MSRWDMEPELRRKMIRLQAIALLGHDPAETPNALETIKPDSERNVRQLLIAFIVERDGPCCYLCARDLTDVNPSIDHIIPLAHGGTHEPCNVALACFDCNIKKRDNYVSMAVSSGAPAYHSPVVVAG